MKPHKTTPVGQLKLLNIPVGRTVTTECPSCGKAKLSVTNKDGTGYLYNCFRASCGTKGYLPLTGMGSFATDDPVQPERQRRPYSGPLSPLLLFEKQFLGRKYGFTDYHLEKSKVRHSQVGLAGRFMFPILDLQGHRKGIQFRSYTGSGPKAITLMERDVATKSSWYSANEVSKVDALGNTVVLVEDIPSAVRLSRYVAAIALLGTTVDPVDIPLMAAKWSTVIVALDPDATEQAFRVQNQLMGWFDWVDLLFLSKDVKDMSEAELYQTIMEDLV